MKKITAGFYIITILFSSCTTPISEKSIKGSWGLANIVKAKDTKDKKDKNAIDAIMEDAGNYLKSSEDLIYNFYEKNLCSMLKEGAYFSGTYSIAQKSKNIVVNFDNGKAEVLKDISFVNNNLQAENEDWGKERLEFKLNPNEVKEEEDPMHPTFNEWRKKALKPETETELKSRLENLLLHYICLLQASSKSKEQTLSLKNSISNIQIYDGGIGIMNYNDDKEVWAGIFYSKENQMQYNKIFEKLLQDSPEPKFESQNKWIEDDIKILKLLLGYLKAH